MVLFSLFLLLLVNQTQSNIAAIENHPCENYPSGTVLQTANGKIVCERKTENELKQQLSMTGGYNRRYAAETLLEARKNFKNMLAKYGGQYNNTDGWRKWRDFEHYSYSLDYASRLNDFKRNIRERNKRKKFRRFTKRDIEIAKREVGSPIQCLESGYKTPDQSCKYRELLDI